MSISTKVLVAGTVMSVEKRSGTNERGPWQIGTALVFGLPGTPFAGGVAEVAFTGDSFGSLPPENTNVTLIAEVSVRRDEDQLRFVRYAELTPTAAKSAPAPSN